MGWAKSLQQMLRREADTFHKQTATLGEPSEILVH